MEIRFYTLNTERKNDVGKYLPTKYIYMNGELRDSQNLMNPEIIIDISTTSNISAVAPTEQEQQSLINGFRNEPFNKCNYVYIPSFKRYYFITNITVMRKNILSFSLHVDVLQFVNFIHSQTAFVARSESNYNELLPDERRIVTNEIETTIITPTDISSEYPLITLIEFDTNFNSYRNPTSDFYNIVALGHTTGVNKSFIENGALGTPVQPIPDVDLPAVRNGAFAVRNFKQYYLNIEEIAQMLHYITNQSSELASSVGSIFAYPIDFKKHFGDAEFNRMEDTFSLGATDIWSGHNAHIGQRGSMSALPYAFFEIPDNVVDFNDLTPYSKYELYIPYYGYWEFDYNAVRGHKFSIYYVINFMDGSATVQIYDLTKQELTAMLQTQLGYEIPKNTSNVTNVRNTHQANNTALGFGLVSSALAVIGGIASFNPVAVAGGVIGAGKSIGDYAKNEKTNIFTTSINFNGSSSPIYSPQRLYIKKTKRIVRYSLTPDFLSNQGGICNKLLELGDISLNGYTEIAEIPNIKYDSIDVIPTDNEITEIISLLKNGVIL